MKTPTSAKIGALVISGLNPRKTYSDAELLGLAESIREQGILQPILVRPIEPVNGAAYEIIAGARRFLAAQAAGLKDVPIRVLQMDDSEALAAMIVENAQRADVHPYEEGEAYRELSQTLTMSEIAHRVGKSLDTVRRRILLRNLTPEQAEHLRKSPLSLSAWERLAAASESDRRAFFESLDPEEPIQPHQVNTWANGTQARLSSSLLPLDQYSPDERGCEPGPCTTCPFNSANHGTLFGDVDPKDGKCLKVSCLKARNEFALESLREQHPDLPLVSNLYYPDIIPTVIGPAKCRGAYRLVMGPEEGEQAINVDTGQLTYVAFYSAEPTAPSGKSSPERRNEIESQKAEQCYRILLWKAVVAQVYHADIDDPRANLPAQFWTHIAGELILKRGPDFFARLKPEDRPGKPSLKWLGITVWASEWHKNAEPVVASARPAIWAPLVAAATYPEIPVPDRPESEWPQTALLNLFAEWYEINRDALRLVALYDSLGTKRRKELAEKEGDKLKAAQELVAELIDGFDEALNATEAEAE